MRIVGTPGSAALTLSRRARLAVFARSFAIQGSWNYRTLIGNGFAFALLPALREIFRDRPADLDAAVERHRGIFNCHPYLSGVALGAVARLEREHEDPALVERFKSAVRGSLGSLGDRLIWAGFRPVCALLALALLFAGLPWWAAVIAFLVIYNAGHLAMRAWGFRLGLVYGKGVGEQLRRSPLGDMQRAITGAGAFLLGMLLPLAIMGGHASTRLPLGLAAVALGAAALGLRYGHRLRTLAAVILAAFTLIGLLYEVIA